MKAVTKELVADFAEAWTLVGGQALVADDLDEARALIAELVHRHGLQTAVAWDDALLGSLDLAPLFAWYRTGGSSGGPSLKAACAQAQVGFVAPALAAADTGTLFMPFGGPCPRSVLILPPVSVAVLPACQLVPTRSELFHRMGDLARSVRPPAEMGLVTGPSRTGDIESLLLQGIHGPASAYAIIVRSAPSS